MIKKKIAIIGAGASGLICSIFCAKSSLDVDLYEQNTKPAKKILASGNGRCNITNKNISKDDYFGNDTLFVDYALKKFGFNEFLKFCKNIGLILNVKNDGRVYPLSNEAKSVASVLIASATNNGVCIKTDTKITDIKKLFLKYDYVVIATGSNAGSHLGGCDDGYNFAREFNHTILPTYPSLVQLHLKSKIAKKMSGSKIDAKVSVIYDNKIQVSSRGDILWTNYGVSGFAILDISNYVSKALLDKKKVKISVNLTPTFSYQELVRYFENLSKSNLNIQEILLGLIPQKQANGILESLDILKTDKQVDIRFIKKISHALHAWEFDVVDTHGFRYAEVSGGGVDTNEIDKSSMQSKKRKNLYFCGEVLDIVGKRGGYNFAFAWASGVCVARDIIKKETK